MSRKRRNPAGGLSGIVASLLNTGSRRASRGRRRRKPARRRRGVISNARVGTAALPAAYSTHVKSWYRTQNLSKNVMRVSGCDLVYKIPATVLPDGN